MTKNFSFGLIFMLALTGACQSSGSQVQFAGNERLDLLPDEKMLPLSRETLDEYGKYCLPATVEAPLSKAVSAEKYRIFIALPFQANQQQFVEQLRRDTANRTVLEVQPISAPDKGQKLFIKSGDRYDCCFVYDKTQPRGTTLLHVLSQDSTVARGFFNQSADLFNRLKRD